MIDATTGKPAIGALTMDFVRSPDTSGADGKGRYLLAVNSGFGVQFDAESNRAEQSIAVIDLNFKPQPQIVQNVYFPTPQSVNFGVRFHFALNTAKPITPASDGKNEKGEVTKITAPFIDVSGLATNAPSPNYNRHLS